MRIQFPEHDEALESIQVFLERHSFPDLKKVKAFLGRLSKIDASLDRVLQKKELSTAAYIEKQKSLVKKLAGRCHKLEVRRSVINLAEDAESLANSSPERSTSDIAREAHALRDRIDRFVQQHRPSRNNAKFIRFARACIDKAERHEKVISGKRKQGVPLDNFRETRSTPETLAIAESLYELATLLYQEKFDEFGLMLLNQFSEQDRKEITYHVSSCQGDLNKLSELTLRLKTIQGILGYAQLLADYYMGNTPYPTLVEVHGIFQDLDLVTHLEDEEPNAPWHLS